MSEFTDTTSPGEAELIIEIADILQRKMARDYAAGATRRDAHPKALGVLRGRFVIEPGLPAELRVGVFREARAFDCWLRASNASGKPQSDAVPDFRGLALKLLDGDDAPIGQDFVLMNHPTMPLGTVRMFRDAVYFSIESSPLLMVAKFLLTGKAAALKALKNGRSCPTSPLDIRYWSTTPYRFGLDRAVKYSLLPTSAFRSAMPAAPTEDYLSRAMQTHLGGHDASFDFCVQLRRDTMPIDDAAVRWDEAASPFVKVATLQIAKQTFRSEERAALGESLSFSPGHAWPDHAPLGGVNRARVAIYQKLSAFRHGRDNRANIA